MGSKRVTLNKDSVEEYESQREQNNEKRRNERATSDITTDLYVNNDVAIWLEETHSLKKYKITNTKKVTKVITRVKKIVTTITTTYTNITTEVDNTACYYNKNTSEPELVKMIKSNAFHEEQVFEGNITTDVSNTSTTNTTTVLESTVSECDDASPYDEFVVSKVESGHDVSGILTLD
jgi:CRISPR/Cas system-associated endonuclease Cas3-HD